MPDDEPEPQPADDGPTRAPVAAKAKDGPDMMQQLQTQSLSHSRRRLWTGRSS